MLLCGKTEITQTWDFSLNGNLQNPKVFPECEINFFSCVIDYAAQGGFIWKSPDKLKAT